jgi:putative oxidoreductase
VNELRLIPEHQSSRVETLVRWMLRGAVTVLFCSVGFSKFSQQSEWTRIFAQIGLGQWFRYFTGVLQIVGGLMVIVPRTFAIGIAVLAGTMLGAVLAWIGPLHAPGNAIIPGALLIGLVAIYALTFDM